VRPSFGAQPLEQRHQGRVQRAGDRPAALLHSVHGHGLEVDLLQVKMGLVQSPIRLEEEKLLLTK
jgi:hypothetical protein